MTLHPYPCQVFALAAGDTFKATPGDLFPLTTVATTPTIDGDRVVFTSATGHHVSLWGYSTVYLATEAR